MKIAVVGAGYAGLAAAVTLADQGRTVDVFEASRSLGGRARAVVVDGLVLDNGAHILVGAYRETLRLMRVVAAPETALRRYPLHLEYPGRMRLTAPRWPAPLHLGWALATAQGLTPADKLAAMRFMSRLKARRFRLPADQPVSQLLSDQPERLRHMLWEPLCLASLNTPPAAASAQVFVNVLRDSLAADRAASDLLLPATDFSQMFPDPAERFVLERGSRVIRSRRIKAIACQSDRFLLNDGETYDGLVLAVAPQHLAPLLADLPALAPVVQQLDGFAYEPIATCYLGYPASPRFPFPMVGIDGGLAQWLFDRGQLCNQPGIVAAVISADTGRLASEVIAHRVDADVRRLWPEAPPPRWSQVIQERQATFACRPGLIRPTALTPIPRLVLAGDYVAGDYPATLEGAVRSGINAARLLLDQTPGV